MNEIARIRAKIEQARDIYNHPNRVVHGVADAFRQDGRVAMCDDLLSFLSTLEEPEVIINGHGIVQKDGAITIVEVDESVSEELEKYAARAGFDYVDDIVLQAEPNHRWNDHDVENAHRDGIIKGASWQKAQDDRLVDIIYQQGIEKGKDEMREQMMKGAEDYVVGMHGESIKITLDKYVQRARGIFPGDKIKIVIVKED